MPALPQPCTPAAPVLHTVYLGLGSNLGRRRHTLQQAISLLGQEVGPVLRQSAFIETEPWGFHSPHPFLNAAVSCLTSLTPRQVLQATQLIEQRLGRRSKSAAGVYHDRPIDIDILLYDDLSLSEPDLHIPHPLMLQRDFVMTPLRQIMTAEDIDRLVTAHLELTKNNQ